MEEEKIIQQELMPEKEFEEKIHDVALNNRKQLFNDFTNGILHLVDYGGVRKYKSVRRAIKRGNVSIFGDLYPNKPFNNRKRNKKGDITNQRRKIYGQYIKKDSKNS